MGGSCRSRSISPVYRRERRRSRSRSWDRDRDRDKDRRRERHRSRSRTPPRKRRSRSPRRRHSRSLSRERSRSRERSVRESDKASKREVVDEPVISEEDLQGKTEEEIGMMKLMGFGSFDSSKGRHVNGNRAYSVNIIHKRKYRQYMNRKGGFNRPLDFVA